ncbi:hypothetical protein [Shimazuella kribbensis]|uniref:hypothetical protein n=1 Tax=Shimazuella kribbensis TaxID=139808 RepID=UPI0003FCED50|nr:hypothetical protein [Shimazuella kribbensis]
MKKLLSLLASTPSILALCIQVAFGVGDIRLPHGQCLGIHGSVYSRHGGSGTRFPARLQDAEEAADSEERAQVISAFIGGFFGTVQSCIVSRGATTINKISFEATNTGWLASVLMDKRNRLY